MDFASFSGQLSITNDIIDSKEAITEGDFTIYTFGA